MMKKYLFFVLALGLFSCSDEEPDVTPECVETRLTTFQDTETCDGDNLTSWDFQGDKVYCFSYAGCGLVAARAEIFDKDCTLLCTLGDGLTTCQGIPWAENASNEIEIWSR